MYNVILLGLSLLQLQAPLLELTFPARPPLGTYVVDEARLLTGHAEKVSAINEIAADQARLRNTPIYVVTIPSLASQGAPGQTIEQYARALFDEWRIGSADHNRGMLLLVSRADRQVRIELGASWGHSRDDDAGRVLDDLVIPEFKKGRFAEGIVAGVKEMEAIAAGTAAPERAPAWWRIPAMAIAFAFAGTAVFALFQSGGAGWGWTIFGALVAGVMHVVAGLLTPKQRSDNDDDAPGYGGGSSGGGGATGRW
jgi:uncharacterized protein